MSGRPMLVVGSPRSGTTLVRDLLRSHSRLTFPPESTVLPALYRAHGDPATAGRARALASDLLSAAPIAMWELDLRPEELETHRSFAGLVGAVYEEWARLSGKRRWGDKTPLHVLELPLLLELFPDAQVVHVVRDGRAVALSLARQSWGPTSVYASARLWRRCIEAGLADGRPLGPGVYHEIRYEELLAEPEPTMRRLCAFLDEPFDPAVLRASRIPPPGVPVRPWEPALEHDVESGNSLRWRGLMSAADRVVFESVAGDTLELLGYETGSERRAIGRGERARWWASDTARLVRWRATALDRGPRLRTDVVLHRARALRLLGLGGG